MIQSLTYVELDLNLCSLSYGTAPCTASIPGTGTVKCYNTLKTCQDRENFAGSTQTVRFCEASDHYPESIDAIPSLLGVNYTPAIVSLGENLGQRASLSVTFKEHPHSDTGPAFDKYVAERGHDPWKRGTFWAKFRARHRSLRGRPIRLIMGEVGQTLEQMEVRHFFVDSFEGPSLDGTFTIVAKDALKFADGDRSQAPRLSNGFLNADLTAVATTATLSPSGVGNLEYPASGHVAIGGSEICAFTRSGDTLTLTRGQYNTQASAHEAQDRVQVCLVFTADPPEDILRTLFVDYCGISDAYIPYDSWAAETASKLGQVYSTCIAEPTGVDKLASEIVNVCGLAVWWDDLAPAIRLRVLGAIATDAALFDRTNVMEGSFAITDQPERRASQIWTYYAQINPLKKVDDADNYRSAALMVDTDAEQDYATPAIMKIHARWIADLGRQVALRVCALQLGRFRDPPRRISLSVPRGGKIAPALGSGYQVQADCLQTADGLQDTIPGQITRLKPEKGHYAIEMQEMLFTPMDDFDPSARTLIIDGNRLNVNLRDAYDQLYPAPDGSTVVTCIVESGVIVGSTSNSVPSLDVGDWPVGCEIRLYVYGRIQGKGGTANGTNAINPLSHGGTALYTRFPIKLYSNSGQLWGGGGGGGFVFPSGGTNSQGGGGQGQTPGETSGGSLPGQYGTTEAPGLGGGNAGDGGAAGQPGQSGGGRQGAGSPGGNAGKAIDGVSLVDFEDAPGSILGPQVN